MEVRTALIADRQAPEAMQPGQRPFDHPPDDAESAPMRCAALGQDRRDPAGAKPLAVRFGVVAAIALERTGPADRAPTSTANRGKGLDHGIQLRDVIDIGGGHLGDKRDPVRLGDDVVLGPRLAAIGWVRSSFFPPRTARTVPLSMIVQRTSSWPRFRSSANKTSCNRCQTPARCHATSRRQHVLPEPHPISRGSICHGSPPRRTNRMPVSAARSGTRGRPPQLTRPRRGFGSSGSMCAHRPSSNNGRAMADRTKSDPAVQEARQRF
jgi:hypothetical protein